MKKLEEYLVYGIMIPTKFARKDLEIFKLIGDKRSEIEKLDSDHKMLYHYVQTAAQDRFILNTAKVYDSKRDRNTRCIESFFDLIRAGLGEFDKKRRNIFLLKLLERDGCNTDLIQKLKADKHNTASIILNYYESVYQSDFIQNKIKQIRKPRNKIIAHNDSKIRTFNLETECVMDLNNFANEISEVFNKAIVNYAIGFSPDFESSYFIEASLKKLGVE